MVTQVTGLWDLGRHELSSFGRSFETQKSNFKILLETFHNENMFILGDDSLKDFVFDVCKRSPHNTHFEVVPLGSIRKMYEDKLIQPDDDGNENRIIFMSQWSQIQKLRRHMKNQTDIGWLRESPQACLEYYNAVVFSKMHFLQNAKTKNPFESSHYFWIDAGLANTVNASFYGIDTLSERLQKLKDFFFVTQPYDNHEIHGMPRNEMETFAKSKIHFVARGGFFGGPANVIDSVAKDYSSLLHQTLSQNLMGTEECIFTMLVYLHSQVSQTLIQANGLLYTFFDSFSKSQCVFSKIQKTQTKESCLLTVYVLTQNSPKQLQLFMERWDLQASHQNEFMKQARMIVVNNSDDVSHHFQYSLIQDRQKFEMISLNKNLGITRGRVFVARHFDQSDASQQMFFEDDMLMFQEGDSTTNVCRAGFQRIVPNLLEKSIQIIEKEGLDFVKLNYSEFHATNEYQYAWFHVGNMRDAYFRDAIIEPVRKVPRMNVFYIANVPGLSQMVCEAFLCNWPCIFSKQGNFKCYLENQEEAPSEGLLMSLAYQKMRRGKLSAGILLASPTHHNRVYAYTGERKEC